jgi:DNA-directed RNA polymerase subunit K/omega
MPKATSENVKAETPLEGLLLECNKDRYKLAYAALRWAKEIKQKENLPDPVPFLVGRAIREILTGKVSIKEVEKLPMIAKVAPPPPPPTPTITLNVSDTDSAESAKE